MSFFELTGLINRMIEKIEVVSILIGALGIIASASFLLFI